MTEPSRQQPDVEEVFHRANLIEERRGDGYIELMVDVYLILQLVQRLILKGNHFDIVDLCARDSNCINFLVNLKGTTYSLPYDIEFVTALDRELMEAVYNRLIESQKEIELRNRRVLINIRNFLDKNKESFFEDMNMNIFEEISKAREKVNEMINLAKTYKARSNATDMSAELRILMEGYYLPANTHFRLLLARNILEIGKENPKYEEVRFFLKESYFKGSVDAFKQSLDDLFKDLAKASALLSDHADQVLGGGVPRKSLSHGSHKSWYRYEMVDDIEDLFDQEHTATMQAWLRLQLYPFDKIKDNWKEGKFRSQFTRLAPKGAKITQKSVEALTRLHVAVLEKADSSTRTRSVAFTSNLAQTRLECQGKIEEEGNRRWIWQNRSELLGLAKEIYDLIHATASEDNEIVLSQDLEASFKQYGELRHERNERARNELLSEFDGIDTGALEEALSETRDLDDDEQVTRLEELLAIYEQAKGHLAVLSQDDTGWFARMRAAFPDWRDLLERQAKVRTKSEKLGTLLQKVETELVDLYDNIGNFSEFPSATLDNCLEIIHHHRMRSFVMLDFDLLDSQLFRQKLARADAEQNPEEALLKFDQLLQELRGIPQSSDLQTALKPWIGKLDKTLKKGYEDFIDQHRPAFDKLQADIRERMRNLLEQQATGTTRIRLEAFDLFENSHELLARELQWIARDIPRISSIKSGRGPAQRFRHLQDRILSAQKFPASEAEISAAIQPLEISPRLAQILSEDIKQNQTHLVELKKKADTGFRDVRLEQKRFGRLESLDHLNIHLQQEDLAKLGENYKIRKRDVEHEAYQHLALAYQNRGKMQDALFEKLLEDQSQPDENIPDEIRSVFGRDDYDKYKKQRTVAPKLKLALLYNWLPFLEAEAQLLIQVLNYSSSDGFETIPICDNFIKIFALANRPDVLSRKWLRRLKGRMSSLLHEYEPTTDKEFYHQNRQTFLTLVERTVGSYLD